MGNLFPLESKWFVAVPAGALAIYMLWQLSRSLPIQNLILIVIGLVVGEGLIDWIFVKYLWVEIDTSVMWYVAGGALLWLALVLLLRRLAQFIIEPWRRERFYGLWVIFITGCFVWMFQFGWPLFNPEPPKETDAAIMGLMRAGATIACLAALTPWLIQKRPDSRKKRRRSELSQKPENKTEQKAEQ